MSIFSKLFVKADDILALTREVMEEVEALAPTPENRVGVRLALVRVAEKLHAKGIADKKVVDEVREMLNKWNAS